MKRILKLTAVLCTAAVLAACGGGGGGGAVVAGADTTVGVQATIASAVAGTAFTFSGGVTELGTTADTTLQFTSSGAAPGFSISSGGNTATGTTNFGSCIFVVATSSFPAGHRLATGQTVTVNPCNIRLATQGAPADSVARQRAAVFILGTAASTGSTVTVVVNPGGTITINGAAAGTVTLVPVTG